VNPLVQSGVAGAGTQVERRLTVRIPTNDPGLLHVLNPASPERFEVRVLDVSKGGFKLLTTQYLHRGMSVQVRVGEIVAQGDVRYCVPARSRRNETGFYVGIEILDVFSIPDAGE
jgi:hypothetical protein